MQTNERLAYADSGSKRTAVQEITLAVGETMPFTKFPEERLYYVLDGRGIMSIYDPAPEGDIYELRQDISIYLTPKIGHELFNTGDSPLRLVVFLVAGGDAPDEGLAWSAVSQRGVTVEKPAAGAGVAVTKVFDELSNPSKEEGQHLRIRDVWLRRPQKFANAEVLTVQPGRTTRLHTHFDTGETSYVLSGEGEFVWDDQQISCAAGSVISYPIGVQRKVVNTGRFPLTYVLMAAFLLD
ncbi:MAG: cupin domain-containing protein [Candidatus Promineifilaceae bacterium]